MHGLNNKCEDYFNSAMVSFCIFSVPDLPVKNNYFTPLFFSK